MIISPKVREYVSNYFGCNDQQIGAVLEDDGGNGTRLSHWEKSIFRN
jgi:leishmanolysin-like peptidase